MIHNLLKTKGPLILIVFLLIAIGLYACGGGSGGSNIFAGGGIGGTGKSVGTVTAFGSVFVNSVEYETTGVPITVNGVTSSEGDLEVGMKVEVLSQNGKASSITYESEIMGPVESNFDPASSSFTVLGQTVIVDVTTIYIGFNSAADLIAHSHIVEVSGFFNADRKIRATYVELKAPGLLEFSVKGTVSQIISTSPPRFKISNLTIDYSTVQNHPSIIVGSFVQAEGTMSGGILMASKLELEDELPEGTHGEEIEFQGVITEVTSQSDFKVNGQRVLTNAQTSFDHGTAADIITNALVEVKGTIDSNGNLVAEEIEFRFIENRVLEIRGHLDAVGVNVTNATVSIFGLTLHITTSTIMKDESSAEVKSFSLNNINDGDFLDIDGFVNNEGGFIASKLERENNPTESGKDRLEGPVDTENPDTSLDILGVTVDVSTASFENEDESSLTVGQFFNAIKPGDIVKAEGDYVSGVFKAVELEIEKIN